MKDELFNDLMASANEMVEIEKGLKKPEPKHVHVYETPDVKAIRAAAGQDQKEFAKLIGASYETLKSWELGRRNPSGTAAKLLSLISHNPKEIIQLLKQTMFQEPTK
ncbi:NadS family protein [Alteromonas sp. a30]|uniref:NadS family protein n=1 Tax=Alteromonas sp. a30 TaxID=2730917 RepID=UPI002282BFB6|nr:NadS family protein [Alteromonas sp. a30]MCY7293817.1 helix-turn-helix domain-containing protein [Alteromonas sp. a30]